MLPPEEQPVPGVGSQKDFEDLKFSSESSNLLKTLDFQFTKPSSVLEKVEEKDECESIEKSGSTRDNSHNSTDFETSEERSDPENLVVESSPDAKSENMSPSPYDSNLTSTEEVGTALKALENGIGPEPADSIVRATFVDFSPEEGADGVASELGKEFSLVLNPDLSKIRAQQVQNWLEFEKDEVQQGVKNEEPLQVPDRPGSREESPPHDFELDSLTMTGGSGNESRSAEGPQDHTVTDADGLQRRVRFLTDTQGNILISVFLTKLVQLFFNLLHILSFGRFLSKNTPAPIPPHSPPPGSSGDSDSCRSDSVLFEVDSETECHFDFCDSLDGEEEEQQQMITFGAEPGHTLIPDGMNLNNFPEIESQLAAFVSHTQQLQKNKTDLVDTDQILRELGVEKDDEQGVAKGEGNGVEEDTEEIRDTDDKTLIPVDTSLSIYEEGDDGGGSETMSTSSCSSMIEVKPKEEQSQVEEGSGKKFRPKLDENNNEILEEDEEAGSSVDVVEKGGSKESFQAPKPSSKTEEIFQETRPETEYFPTGDSEEPKFTPKLVEIELKTTPNPPPAPITPILKPHPPSSVNLPFLVKNGDFPHPDEPCYNTSNENVVTVQVGGESCPYDPDEAEQQFESLCIEEEPISAVAVTIAKWENFSRKQQAAAESGESKVNIAVKGLGKLILPMYTPGQNPQQYINTAPIKMGGPATPMKPMKHQGHGHGQSNNNGSSANNKINNGTNNKLWNGCGWTNNGTGLTTNQNTSPKILAQIEKVSSSTSSSGDTEEETIYAQPNSQAGTLNMIVNSSNPSTLLKSYPKPNSRGEIINWFKEGEIHRSGILLSYGQSSTHHSTHIIPQPLTGPIVVSWFFGEFLIN